MGHALFHPVKTCPPLPTPKHGNMICDRDDFSFSTVCRFTCDTGYKLVGSRKRECLAIAFWTGIPTRCKGKGLQHVPPPPVNIHAHAHTVIKPEGKVRTHEHLSGVIALSDQGHHVMHNHVYSKKVKNTKNKICTIIKKKMVRCEMM